MEINYFRTIGMMTIVMGAFYFPTLLGLLWGIEIQVESPLSLIWCFIQLVIGVVLSTNAFLRMRGIALLVNFLYQLFWGILIVQDLVSNADVNFGKYFYLFHLMLAISSGWYYVKYRKAKKPSLR